MTKGDKNQQCTFKLQVTPIFILGEEGELKGGGERLISKYLKRTLLETCHILDININLETQKIGLY